MEDIIKIFHIDWKLLIAQFINFGIVFGVLYWYGLRKVGVMMRERSEKIAKGIRAAEENEALKIESAQKVAAELAVARKDAKAIMDKAHDEAAAYGVRVKSETDEKAKALLARTEREVAEQKAKIVADSKQSIVSLAAGIAKQAFKELGLSESAEVTKAAIKKIEASH